MKVDLENKAELRKKRAELQHWIAVIDLALGTTPSNGSVVPVVVPPAIAPFYDQLAEQFTSSDVYGLVEIDKRQSVKLGLKEAVSAGFLTILELGKGRRPTVYRKN